MLKTLAALMLLSVPALASPADAWIVVHDGDSFSIHGDVADLEAAKSHLRELGPGYLWFRHEGKQYVVQGEGLKEISALAGQQSALGAEQSRLGRAQAELGRRQGELGKDQGAAGSEQARSAMREDGEGQSEAGETQRQLGRAQQSLGREQAKLGREQAKLGEQQRLLSKQMEEKVRKLIETSLRDGTAKAI
jgi:bla regulator protein blaR1